MYPGPITNTRGLRGRGGSSDTGSGGVADKPIAPSITTPPASQSVVAGKTATFSVVATGSATLAYQWKKNGADISGANTNTYTTPATSDADIGAVLAYSVVVSNTAGSATSTDAKLTVTAALVAPVITTQPVNQSVVVGQSATFSVIATGGDHRLPVEEKRHRHQRCHKQHLHHTSHQHGGHRCGVYGSG